MPDDQPRTVAFHLPQYHRIPENDAWWGEGFTDWVNVARADPVFAGHDQPRVPTDLGRYDLTDAAVLRLQSDLAGSAGIDAFCFYFYWFDGQRLLEKPVDLYAAEDDLLPYCLCWANEAWTRRWDGKHQDVLMPQTYSAGFADEIFADLLHHLLRPHYLTHAGRPVLVVHRADEIPEAASVAARWRELAVAAGLPGLYLVAAETRPGIEPSRLGFDALTEFPPVGSNTLGSALRPPVPRLASSFRGRLLSYDRMARRFTERAPATCVRHRGVTPGWDNTARRRGAATIYVGSSPRAYARWLARARAEESAERGRAGLVFVNAWNEWAEGAYLEPDATWGDAYLRASRPGVDPGTLPAGTTPRGRWWRLPQLRSLALLGAGSALALVRRVRARSR